MSITAVCWARKSLADPRKHKVSGAVIELLGPVRLDPWLKLVGIAVAAACPLKGQRCKNSCHGMIGMSGHATIRSERKHYIRAESTYLQSQLIHNSVQFLAIELPIGVVENDWVCDP